MRTSTILARPSVALAALSVLFLAGCAGQSEHHNNAPLGTDTALPGSEAAPAGPTPDFLVKATNTRMLGQSFHTAGTTTAFPGATQETWSDPHQGLHMKVTGTVSGDVYCKDGTSYTSAPLFAAALRQRGQSLTVPHRLENTYVTTKTVTDCDMYYRIPETAQAAPERDRLVHGTHASAFATPAGSTQDVYFVQDGHLRLLLVESTRDGRTSSTTYDSYGKTFSITMPPAGRSMTIDQFRAAAHG